MGIQSLLTDELSSSDIDQITELKDSYWSFGKNSQLSWFKNNVKKNDIHNIVKVNKSIIAYTLLKLRTYEDPFSVKESKYLNFDTMIIKKKNRNFPNLRKLMKHNNEIIISNKMLSFLLCDDDKINMYKFFGWRVIKNNYFRIYDRPFKQKGMIFNILDTNFINKKVFSFYWNK